METNPHRMVPFSGHSPLPAPSLLWIQSLLTPLRTWLGYSSRAWTWPDEGWTWPQIRGLMSG
jgi:hypothetical protein